MLLAYNFNKSNSGNKWYQIAQRFTKTKLMQIIDYSSNLRLRGKSWLLQKTFIVLVFGGKKHLPKKKLTLHFRFSIILNLKISSRLHNFHNIFEKPQTSKNSTFYILYIFTLKITLIKD